MLSREQFLADVDQWGYPDGRLKPEGNMSQQEIDAWTRAIAESK